MVESIGRRRPDGIDGRWGDFISVALKKHKERKSNLPPWRPLSLYGISWTSFSGQERASIRTALSLHLFSNDGFCTGNASNPLMHFRHWVSLRFDNSNGRTNLQAMIKAIHCNNSKQKGLTGTKSESIYIEVSRIACGPFDNH